MIVIAFMTFILGGVIGVSGKDVREVEVIKEVPVEVTVEANDDTWRKLKEVDDQGFMVAGESLELCSAGFYAVSQLDANTLEVVVSQIPAKSEKMTELAQQRQELLKELGY